MSTPRAPVEVLIALRKAAALVWRVPQLGAGLGRIDRPGVRVARWPAPSCCTRVTVPPARFHRSVAAAHAGRDRSLAATLGFEVSAPGRVELFGRHAVEIEPLGLIRLGIPGGVGTYLFAALVDDVEAATRLRTAPRRWGGGGVQVGLDHDPDLEVTIAHASFPLGDPSHERDVRDALRALSMSWGVDEVAAGVAAASRGRVRDHQNEEHP